MIRVGDGELISVSVGRRVSMDLELKSWLHISKGRF